MSKNGKWFLICIYCSLSHNHDEFKTFCPKFDVLLSNINDEFPICVVGIGDFNAGDTRCCKNDITNSAGLELYSFTSSAGYTHIIDKSAFALNSSMSCIDLIFCTNLNVISKHSVDVSIFDKCHNDIIYGKINIIVPVPTIYVREFWNYRKANVENIKNKYLTLTGIKLLKTLQQVKKLRF